jgi:ADP-ribosylglycohydrolase
LEEHLLEVSRFEGCLVGLAVGDALGMPFEGMRASAIRNQVGRVSDFIDAPWRILKAGQWTDDTKMMLYQARSIADSHGIDAGDTARKFVEWLQSNDWRGIGGSTYSALKRLAEGADPGESGEEGEMAAGNGVAMRIAPVGLLDCLEPQKLRKDVETVGMITHRNHEAVAGGQAVAYAVARGARGDLEISSLIDETVKLIGPCLVADRLLQASRFLSSGMDVAEATARLGTGGYVVETVASAFYCFLHTPDDFEETVSTAVAGGLDADTTGAVAGAISGAFNGLAVIPERWRKGVEGYDEIVQLAREIYRLTLQVS